MILSMFLFFVDGQSHYSRITERSAHTRHVDACRISLIGHIGLFHNFIVSYFYIKIDKVTQNITAWAEESEDFD